MTLRPRGTTRALKVAVAIAISAAALGLAFTAAAPAVARARPHTWLADLLERRVTGGGAFAHLEAWQQIADASGGNRAAQTNGFSRSADYLVGRLEQAGYRVVRQPVPFDYYQVDAERIEEVPAADPVRTLLARWSPSTPAGGIDATVVAAPLSRDGQPDPTPGCEADDFAGLPVSGAVVIAPRAACGLIQQQQVAARLGARAFLFYVITPRPDNIYRFFIFSPALVAIPIASLTQRRAEELAAEAARGPVVLHLELRAHTVQAVTENILAETSGGRSGRVVMAGAHLDSVDEGPGINDNASSASALLETAIRLAPFQHLVENKVRFAWWGAEELVDVGSTYYVTHLDPAQLGEIALYLNYELIASPNFGRFIMDGDDSDHGGVGTGPGPPGSGAVEQVLVDYYASRGLAAETVDISSIGSDHEPFKAAGVPIGGLHGGTFQTKTAEQAARYGGQAGDMYDPCYHQPCDTTANLHRVELDHNVRAIAWVIGRFALELP